MPSAPHAERSRWPRRLTLAAITVALASLTYHPICSAVFDCGCSWFFAGAADTCDIHVPGPPDCPVCTQVPAGAAFSAVMLAGWGAAVAFAAGRLRPRGRILVGLFLVFALQARPAQARGGSTPEERVRVVALTRSLERDPLGESAAAGRRWLREWITDVPDIRFASCPDLMGHALGAGYPYSREVNDQALFSGAAFTIERQDKARDDVAVYTAGVEGALRVYEVLVKSRTDARSAFLDDLIVRRNRGELLDDVAKLAKEKCKRSNTLWIPAAIGAGVGLLLAILVARWFRRRAGHGTTRTATISRAIVFACAAYYVTVGAALHVLEPGYDPRYRFMSDYAWSAHGWLMTTTFFVLGLAAVTVAAGLRDVHQASWGARTGCGWLVVGALFVCLAGVFRGFPLHEVAGAVGIPGISMAALLLSWSFRRAAGWRAIHPGTLSISLAMLAALLSMIAQVGMPGLQQRAFLFLFLLWLSIVAHRSVRVTQGGAA